MRQKTSITAARKPSRHSSRIALPILAGGSLLAVVAAILIVTFDWNRAKPWLNGKISRAIGRPFVINGDLHVGWPRNTETHGWSRWLSGPYITAENIEIGNPDRTSSRRFAHADRVELELNLLPLFASKISIPFLQLRGPSANFERLEDERNNWTLSSQQEGRAFYWKLDIDRIAFDQGQFTLVDRIKKIDANVSVKALQETIAFDQIAVQRESILHDVAASRVGSKGARHFREHVRHSAAPQNDETTPQSYLFEWTASGTFQAQPLHGSGKIGGLLALKNAEQPLALQADLQIADTRIAVIGSLLDLTGARVIDARLWLSGASLAHLYNIIQINLPETPPYVTEGQLAGNLGGSEGKLQYQGFTARIGQSDLTGNLEYSRRAPRPLLSGKIESQTLQLRDLGPLIGLDVTAKQKPESGKLVDAILPTAPFRPERWGKMDADIQFVGDRVLRESELPIHRLNVHITMDEAVLALDPLQFRYADGDIKASVRLNGNGKPIQAKLAAQARGVRLDQVMPAFANAKVKLAYVSGNADLVAHGDSVAAMLGVSSGELKLLLNGGTVSKALLETIGLNLANVLITKLVGDRQVDINCAAADFVAVDGVYDARLFALDTDVSRINVDGEVNLRDERLNLSLHSNSKGVRVLSFRTPINIEGTLKEPHISIDKAALLKRGAGAVALGVIATPIAALLPLTATDSGEDPDNCALWLNELQKEASKPSGKK